MLTPQLVVITAAVILANFLFTHWFIGFARRKSLTDIPNKRSSHVAPTPKSGGIGFVLFSLAGWMVYLSLTGGWNIGFMTYYLVAAGIAMLGWMDDRHELSSVLRFLVQTVAAIFILLLIGWLDYLYLPTVGLVELGFMGGLLSWLWIVGMINIYNFMDGVDGIASVQAITASTGWMVFSAWYDLPELFALNLILLAAVGVFLLFNWAPASIFMGDTGSLFLGLTYAVMPIMATHLSLALQPGFVIWIGILLLWPFLFDGVYTLIRRTIRGENIFLAHRTHLYQRLNISGWSHSKISGLYMSFSLGCIILTLVVIGQESIPLHLFLLLFILSGCYAFYVSTLVNKA